MRESFALIVRWAPKLIQKPPEGKARQATVLHSIATLEGLGCQIKTICRRDGQHVEQLTPLDAREEPVFEAATLPLRGHIEPIVDHHQGGGGLLLGLHLQPPQQLPCPLGDLWLFVAFTPIPEGRLPAALHLLEVFTHGEPSAADPKRLEHGLHQPRLTLWSQRAANKGDPTRRPEAAPLILNAAQRFVGARWRGVVWHGGHHERSARSHADLEAFSFDQALKTRQRGGIPAACHQPRCTNLHMVAGVWRRQGFRGSPEVASPRLR